MRDGETFIRRRSTVPILSEEDKPKKTQQQFKSEVDINRIVEKARRGIVPTFLAKGTPVFGDFSHVPDLTEAYDAIERAQEAFMSLPAKLRQELDNDPRKIVELTEEQVDRYKIGKKHAEKAAWEKALKERRYQRDLDRALDVEEQERAPSPPTKPSKGAGKPPKGAAPTQPGGGHEGD